MGFAGMGTFVNPGNPFGHTGGVASGGVGKHGNGSGGNDDDYSNFSKFYAKFGGKFPAPNLRQAYDRSADLSIVSAGGNADQAKNDFMASGGAKFGSGGHLVAGAMKADALRGAESDAARIRTQGAESQFAAENQNRDFIFQLFKTMLAKRQADKERMLREKYVSTGGHLGAPGFNVGAGQSYLDNSNPFGAFPGGTPPPTGG